MELKACGDVRLFLWVVWRQRMPRSAITSGYSDQSFYCLILLYCGINQRNCWVVLISLPRCIGLHFLYMPPRHILLINISLVKIRVLFLTKPLLWRYSMACWDTTTISIPYEIPMIFISPEQVVLKVRYFDRPAVHCLSSVSIWHLLLNHWANFNHISQEWSLGDTDWKLFKEFHSMQNSGCHGNKKAKTSKTI